VIKGKHLALSIKSLAKPGGEARRLSAPRDGMYRNAVRSKKDVGSWANACEIWRVVKSGVPRRLDLHFRRCQ